MEAESTPFFQGVELKRGTAKWTAPGWAVRSKGAMTAGTIPKLLVVEHSGSYYHCHCFPVLNSAADWRANQGLVIEKKCPCSATCFVNMTPCPSVYWFNTSILLEDGRL